MTPELREALLRAWPLNDPLGLAEYVEAITPIIDAAIVEATARAVRDERTVAFDARQDGVKRALLAAADDLDSTENIGRERDYEDTCGQCDIRTARWLRARANEGSE